MTKEVLSAILDSVPSVKRVKEEHSVSPEVDLTLYAGTQGEGLSVARVVRVELKPAYVRLETAKGENLCLVYEHLNAVRWIDAAAEKRAGLR